MSRFEILDGLPPYGAAALPFPEDGRGAFREGLVVQFHQGDGAAWVGNFQRGFSQGSDYVIDHPDGHQVIVIAGGAGYIVDPDSQRQTHSFGAGINFAQQVPSLNLVVIGDGIRLAAFCAGGVGWDSDRISWDGMRGIAITGSVLRGEAWSPISDAWHPFEVDLLTGKSRGAVYPEQMAGAVRIGPQRA